MFNFPFDAKTLKSKLQIVQNKIARYILNRGPRTHIGQKELDSIEYLNIQDRVTQLSLHLVHDIFYGNSPSYMTTHFKKTEEVHSHGNRGREKTFLFHM